MVLTISSFAQQKESLFNGKNLDGWSVFVSNSTISPENFFYVKDGVIETVIISRDFLALLNTILPFL